MCAVSRKNLGKGKDMSKAIITMGYRSIVMDVDEAVKVVELLAKGEMYEEKYHSAVGETPSYYTHHIYAMDNMRSVVDFRLISDEEYRMYSLAGKPDK